MKTHKLAITVALLGGLGAACGGSNTGKLSSHVNQAHLAPVSAAERASEAEAQREFFLSEWQLAFTESQIKGAKLDIDIAKNELASAKLAVKNAKLELKAAEETGDANAISKQQQAERVAHLQVEVRKIEIDRAKQNKRYLEKRRVHEERSMRSREAGVELARAESLKGAGIKPPDFDAKRYKGQHAERVSSAKEAKGPADSEKTKLTELDKRLVAAKNAALAAEGKPAINAPSVETKPMEDLPDKPPVDVTPGDQDTPKGEGEAKPDDAAAKDDAGKTETTTTPTEEPSSDDDKSTTDTTKKSSTDKSETDAKSESSATDTSAEPKP